MSKILAPNQSYTFSKIFELKPEIDDLVEEFGYNLIRQSLNLTKYEGKLDRLNQLEERIKETLPYVNLANETTRREILIAPIVTDLIHYTHAQLRIEYQLKVTEQLQGYLDYYLKTKTNLLVIEAKQEDMTNGFTQLAVELIALDNWEKSPSQSSFLGAVTTGLIWQFGVLKRQEKQIIQVLNSYRVPEDLEELMRILVKSLLD